MKHGKSVAARRSHSGSLTEWAYPDTGEIQETVRRDALRALAEGRRLDAAHAWVGMRDTALLLLGPGAPPALAAFRPEGPSRATH
ncbi:MAG: hypothetical protein LBQ12_03350 [Deltaproteobacteria bacterium]|nr:hypothetical protein [Deltaproteobacteria bacterium]